MRARQERFEVEQAPRFERARSWRAWHEWPGIMGLASGLALWVFFVAGVVVPLGDAVARFQSPSVDPAPACVLTDYGTLPAGEQACVCACPASAPAGSRPRM